MKYAPRTLVLQLPHRTLELGRRTHVMGIVNVTPDSFSDGGRYFDSTAAIEHGRRLAADGADLLDVGGESTRPGSQPVTPDEQIRRVVPVIRGLRAAGVNVSISVDTRSAEVAEAGLNAGAEMVNDISALGHDPAMAALCARTGAAVILMHMRGLPATMQQSPAYADVVLEVADFLRERVAAAAIAGVSRDRLVIDPGIGFGKTFEHNLALLRRLDAFVSLGLPVMIGASRKAFLGQILDRPEPRDRDIGTCAVTALCAMAGVQIVRVHDVRAARDIANVCAAIR